MASAILQIPLRNAEEQSKRFCRVGRFGKQKRHDLLRGSIAIAGPAPLPPLTALATAVMNLYFERQVGVTQGLQDLLFGVVAVLESKLPLLALTVLKSLYFYLREHFDSSDSTDLEI